MSIYLEYISMYLELHRTIVHSEILVCQLLKKVISIHTTKYNNHQHFWQYGAFGT